MVIFFYYYMVRQRQFSFVFYEFLPILKRTITYKQFNLARQLTHACKIIKAEKSQVKKNVFHPRCWDMGC